MNNCLFCYNQLEKGTDYHERCSKKFFGTTVPPELDVTLKDVEKLALMNLGRSSAVTGVQPKLSLDIAGGHGAKERSRLTIVGLWGKYILKPPYEYYKEMPETEDLTMKLADVSGIKTASHSLIRLRSGELAYISKRFDRTDKNKLHVEDFAQILEELTERKYSGSIERVGKAILNYSSFPGNDIIDFFELILCCFLTGNADMHLKNFALIRDINDDIKLSPAYDLISTNLLLPQDREESALTINGKKANLKRSDFDKLASVFKINEKVLTALYKKYSGASALWYPVIDKSFLSPVSKENYKKLIDMRRSQIQLI